MHHATVNEVRNFAAEDIRSFYPLLNKVFGVRPVRDYGVIVDRVRRIGS